MSSSEADRFLFIGSGRESKTPVGRRTNVGCRNGGRVVYIEGLSEATRSLDVRSHYQSCSTAHLDSVGVVDVFSKEGAELAGRGLFRDRRRHSSDSATSNEV